MHTNTFLVRVIGLLVLLLSISAFADPPSRVARLSFLNGIASFSPGGTQEWVTPALNRPLITGDRVWVEKEGRLELQMGSAVVRLGSSTHLAILNLDKNIAQFQLSQGMLFLHVRGITPGQIYEVDTPNLSLIASRPGNYEIDVDDQGMTTQVTVIAGQASVYGQDNLAYAINKEQSCLFSSTNLSYRNLDLLLSDLAVWSMKRDLRSDNAASLHYISDNVIGYEDLDNYGRWQPDNTYGHVWVPSTVSADWAPYRTGHWEWITPWGWTWIGDEAWGFAPFHYGRWVYLNDHWGWVPGPSLVEPIYAPALVAFMGGKNFSWVGWFPLSPDEVYTPPYTVSEKYFIAMNMSINRTLLRQLYNHPELIHYKGANLAATVVPTATFILSQSVAQAILPLSPVALSAAKITLMPTLRPIKASLLGTTITTSVVPPLNILSRTVLIKTMPGSIPTLPKMPVKRETSEQASLGQRSKKVKQSALPSSLSSFNQRTSAPSTLKHNPHRQPTAAPNQPLPNIFSLEMPKQTK